MLTNPRADRVRSVAGLARRSVRERTGRFLVEGPQGVREAVRHRPDLVQDIYVTAEARARHEDIVEGIERSGLRADDCTPEVLAAMADTPAPQGILAICRQEPASLADVLAGSPHLLCVLTHVRDPGNAGTVLRAADAAGAAAVVVSSDSVDMWSPKVVRSTAGSLFHLPVVAGLPAMQILSAVRSAGLRLLAADGGGRVSLPDADLDSQHAWVFGNEAWGLPQDLRDACDEVVSVPILGRAESLNLAMAATVCLYASALRSHPPAAPAPLA